LLFHRNSFYRFIFSNLQNSPATAMELQTGFINEMRLVVMRMIVGLWEKSKFREQVFHELW